MAVGTHALRPGGRSLSFKDFPGPFPSPFAVVRLVPPFPFPPSSGAYGDSLHFSPALRQVGNEGLGPWVSCWATAAFGTLAPAAPGSPSVDTSQTEPRCPPTAPAREAMVAPLPHRSSPWDREGSRASPAGDVPNAGQSRSPGAPEAVGTPLPWQGPKPALAPNGDGAAAGTLARPWCGCPLGCPGGLDTPGGLETPGHLGTPVAGADFSAVSDLCREQGATFPRERARAGSSPSSICSAHPEPPEPPHSWVPSARPARAQGAPVPPVWAGPAAPVPERPVPWEEPARDGRVSFGLAVGRVDNEELL